MDYTDTSSCGSEEEDEQVACPLSYRRQVIRSRNVQVSDSFSSFFSSLR